MPEFPSQKSSPRLPPFPVPEGPNNAYGHEVGDALLKGLGETVVQGLRPSDILGRWARSPTVSAGSCAVAATHRAQLRRINAGRLRIFATSKPRLIVGRV